MKFLILSACALVVVAAQWAPAHHGAYHGAYHVPVIGPHGVPLDTPEVQHARAAHLAALGEAASRGGPAYHGDNGQYNDQGNYIDNGYQGHRYYGPQAYQTSYGVAKVTHDGVPLDTPEVAAAKAHHFSAFSEALSRNAHYGPGHHYRKRRSIYAAYHGAYHGPHHIPVIGPHGVPIDTPEVQHARAAHFAALASAGHGYGHQDGGHYAVGPVYAHGYVNGFQGLDHDGRPLDTPEVAHAKAAHYAAYNEAAHRNGVHGHVGHVGIYAAPYAHGYHSNGAPHDTPEVQHAKAAHFAAHAAARAGHNGHYY